MDIGSLILSCIFVVILPFADGDGDGDGDFCTFVILLASARFLSAFLPCCSHSPMIPMILLPPTHHSTLFSLLCAHVNARYSRLQKRAPSLKVPFFLSRKITRPRNQRMKITQTINMSYGKCWTDTLRTRSKLGFPNFKRYTEKLGIVFLV